MEPWPKPSKLNSWKFSFRRRVTTGSTHPRLISDWLVNIALEANMADLDHAGFAFDKHQIEFDTPDSEIFQIYHGDSPTELKRKIQIQYRTGRQIIFKCARSSTSTNSGVYYGLERFVSCRVAQRQTQDVQSVLGKTFSASGNDLDEHFLENCFQRHVVKSTLT